MKTLVRLFFLVLCLAQSLPAFCQKADVSARVDTSGALIGEQIQLTIEATKPVHFHLVFPEFKDTLTSKIEIVNRTAVDTSLDEEGVQHLFQQLKITVFDTGVYEIPGMAFLVSADSLEDTLLTDPITLRFLSMPLDSSIRDIKGIMKAPVTARDIIPWVGGALLILAAAWLTVWYVRRNYGKERIASDGKPSEPPHVIALRELQKIKEEQAWLRMPVKAFHIRLTDIMRTYLSHRFGIPALEQTTEEIIAALKQAGCDAETCSRLQQMLRLADWVKFARVDPGQNESARMTEEAVSLVNHTAHTAAQVPSVNETPGGL